MEHDHDATYSPEDNKLRLYPAYRLDKPLYERVRAAGFRWAAKQELFVAPRWNPDAADLLVELCGDIGDELTSAEERAERFAGYRANRRRDADEAKRTADGIADGIPFGQPILVGHQSERHARADQRRIENATRRAVNAWNTSKYWESRAAGVLRNVNYKSRPDVRHRRILKLERDLRRFRKEQKDALTMLKLWRAAKLTTTAQAMTLAELGYYGLWGRLDKGEVTIEDARREAINHYIWAAARPERWIQHLDRRLTYERTLLDASGWKAPTKKRRKLPPLLNYRAESITAAPKWSAECIVYGQMEATKAEFKRVHGDYKGTRVSADGTHRFRIVSSNALGKPRTGASTSPWGGVNYVAVFLTDSKEHLRPEPQEVKRPDPLKRPVRIPAPPKPVEPKEEEVRRLAKRGPVEVVVADQLFPTPPELAAKMVAAADIGPGQRILEPSAGTGNLVAPILASLNGGKGSTVYAVEKDVDAFNALEARGKREGWPRRRKLGENDLRTLWRDFLEVGTDQREPTKTLGRFHRVVMNPPFSKGADVRHIRHARKMLYPGGRLVALCADGPRQREAFKDEDYRPLGQPFQPATGVRVAMVVLTGEEV